MASVVGEEIFEPRSRKLWSSLKRLTINVVKTKHDGVAI